MKVTHSRLDLMDTVQVDNVDEKDPLSTKFTEFSTTRNVSYHRTLSGEVRRPDLVSQREYASPNFWWFVLKSNGVVDPFDLPEGELLGVPNIMDYYEFAREQRST